MRKVFGMPVRSDSTSRAFRFADLAIHSANAGSESESFLRTIQIVRNDLDMVGRLLEVNAVQARLAYLPERYPWIMTAIISTTSALDEIGNWVENMSIQQQNKPSRHSHQLPYILQDSERLAIRKTELTTCHRQLSNVLSFLNRLDDLSTHRESPERSNNTNFDNTSVPGHDINWGASNESISHHTPQTQDIPPNTLDIGHANPMSPIDPYQPINFNIDAFSRNMNTLPYPLTPTMPSSPPPSYSSTQLHLHSQPSHQDLRKHIDYTTATKRSYSDPTTAHLHNTPALSSHKPAIIHAYTQPELHKTTPELEGDTLYQMSATNSAGPVNPFALHSPMSTPNLRTSPSTDKKSMAELLGDMNLAAELPGDMNNIPHSTQHLLAREKQQQRYSSYTHSHIPSIPTMRAGYNAHSKYISELADSVPVVRPVELASHSITRKSVAPRISLQPPTPQIANAAVSLSGPLPDPSSLSHSHSISQLRSHSPSLSPSHSLSQSQSLSPSVSRSPSQSQPQSQLSSRSSSSSLPHPLSHSLSREEEGDRRASSQDNKTDTTATALRAEKTKEENTVQQQQQQPVQTAALGRMRRQKYMLDLLGSIES